MIVPTQDNQQWDIDGAEFTEWYKSFPVDDCENLFKPEKQLGYSMCIDQAKVNKIDWVLVIDADEVLRKELPRWKCHNGSSQVQKIWSLELTDRSWRKNCFYPKSKKISKKVAN